jgi:hypothetical protein
MAGKLHPRGSHAMHMSATKAVAVVLPQERRPRS